MEASDQNTLERRSGPHRILRIALLCLLASSFILVGLWFGFKEPILEYRIRLALRGLRDEHDMPRIETLLSPATNADTLLNALWSIMADQSSTPTEKGGVGYLFSILLQKESSYSSELGITEADWQAALDKFIAEKEAITDSMRPDEQAMVRRAKAIRKK